MLNLPFVTAQFRAPRQPGGGPSPILEESLERAAVDA
jgi:hypothetical protein